MKRILTLIIAVLLAGGIRTYSRDKAGFLFFGTLRTESQVSFNFFTGPDAALFAPSAKGFGSGLLDPFGTRTSIDLVEFRSERIFVSAGAGFSVLKYRLAENLVFGKPDGNTLTWNPDTVASHNYVNTFFGYGKSKIITTSFYFPVDVHLRITRNAAVSAGGYLDLNLTARYKTKYLSGEDRVKEIIRSPQFRKFDPSTVKFGVNATFLHKKFGYGLSVSYCLTPFFTPGTGPDIHETRISLSYTIRNIRDIFREREKQSQ